MNIYSYFCTWTCHHLVLPSILYNTFNSFTGMLKCSKILCENKTHLYNSNGLWCQQHALIYSEQSLKSQTFISRNVNLASSFCKVHGGSECKTKFTEGLRRAFLNNLSFIGNHCNWKSSSSMERKAYVLIHFRVMSNVLHLKGFGLMSTAN